MINPFAHSLRNFSLSVDIVDDETYRVIQDKLHEYAKGFLNIQHLDLLVESRVNQNTGLQTVWSMRGERWSENIFDSDKNYTGQVSLAYHKGINLWIVSPDQGHLKDTTKYEDLWRNADASEIPRYVPSTNARRSTRTSINLPIKDKRSNKISGVACFESHSFLERWPAAEEQFLTLAEIVQNIYFLHQSYLMQQDSTRQALRNLKIPEGFVAASQAGKPRAFLASSGRARDDIMSCAREVLDEFIDEIDVIYWKDITEAGNINMQILQAISSCRFGVCYLSEVCEDAPERYRDNPNVLFEAGMLHALSGNPASFPVNWIPIREDADDLPFDFAAERMLFATRSANGRLNQERFKENLRNMIKNIIGQSS